MVEINNENPAKEHDKKEVCGFFQGCFGQALGGMSQQSYTA